MLIRRPVSNRKTVISALIRIRDSLSNRLIGKVNAMSNKLRSFIVVLVSIVVVMSALPMNALRVNADSFILIYDGNGGTYTNEYGTFGTSTKSPDDNGDVTVEDNSKVGFSRDGYAFAGWNEKPDGDGETYTNGTTFNLPELGADKKIYAQWAETRTITFDANYPEDANNRDGSMPAQTFVVDQSANLNANQFSCKEYSFAGWNTDKDGNGTPVADGATYEFNAGDPDIILYAQWTPKNPRTITFYPNPPTTEATVNGTMDKIEDYQGNIVTLTANAYTCNGYIFRGWNTNSDGTSGVDYSNGASVLLTDSDIDLYAKWEEGWVVSFDSNGGSETLDPVTVAKDSSYTVPDSKSITREGYRLTGWTINTADGTFVSAGSDIPSVTSDMTLYAQWQEIYTITYDANGGTGSLPDQTFDVGSQNKVTVADPGTAITYPGYDFLGWKNDAGKDYTPNTEFTPEGNITLYAQWGRIITLHANDGTDTTYLLKIPVGATNICSIADTSFTAPDGKEFFGWTTSATSEELFITIDYAECASIDITSDKDKNAKDLYAQWAVPVTITFNANDSEYIGTASGLMPTDFKIGAGIYSKLPDNVYELYGYSFNSWIIKDSNLSDKVSISSPDNGITVYITIDEGSVPSDKTIPLYATWSEEWFSVTIKDWDGTVLMDNVLVPYGTIPSCSKPTRPDTVEHTYIFAGWYNIITQELFEELPAVSGSDTYVATYEELNRPYNVTASVSPSDAGTISVNGSNRYNETAAFTVEPAVGYHVVSWTNNDDDAGTAATAYDFVVSGDHNVVVYLEKDRHTVNVSSSGGGEVVYNGPDNPVYGTIVNVVATPMEGYHFVKWVDQDGNQVRTDAAIEFTVTDDYSYKAIFELNQYNISVTAGEHGSVSGSDKYTHFDTCEIVATADKGYHFTGWYEDGKFVSEKASYSFTVEGIRNFEARFEINVYTVTYKNDDGTVLQESELEWGSTASYNHIAKPTKKPTAQYTYTFAGWDNKETLVTKDITYTATYTSTINKYKITFANEDGTVLQTSEVEYGKFPVYDKSAPTKSATVEETFTFAGWDKEIAKVTGDTTYTATYTSKPITKDSINYKYFTVAFVSNGGSEVVSQLVAEGGVAFKPEEPLRERYSFGGWYIDEALTKPFSFATAITSDITLYAKWVKGAPEVEATYAVIGMGSTTVDISSGEDITIAVERSKDNDSIAKHFVGVQIDGVDVDYYNYELSDDNSSVIISADALNGLDEGTHTITIVYDDGTAEVELIVADSNKPVKTTEEIIEPEPVTGNEEPVNVTVEKNNNAGLWIALAIVAGVVVAAIPIFIVKIRSLK